MKQRDAGRVAKKSSSGKSWSERRGGYLKTTCALVLLCCAVGIQAGCSRHLCREGSGSGSANTIAAKLILSDRQYIPTNEMTALHWDYAPIDGSFMIDLDGDDTRITCRRDGTYYTGLGVSWAIGERDVDLNVNIMLNSNIWAAQARQRATNRSPDSLYCGTILQLESGDILQAKVKQNSGVPLSVIPLTSQFFAYRIGD